jgi:hypothetical protein
MPAKALARRGKHTGLSDIGYRDDQKIQLNSERNETQEDQVTVPDHSQ